MNMNNTVQIIFTEPTISFSRYVCIHKKKHMTHCILRRTVFVHSRQLIFYESARVAKHFKIEDVTTESVQKEV